MQDRDLVTKESSCYKKHYDSEAKEDTIPCVLLVYRRMIMN